MADPPTDADLLGTVGAAQAAFAMLVRRHSGPLYAIAWRRLGSAVDAEEVVQDAFLLLWRKRGRVRLVGGSALPWLIVSVKHVAANRVRGDARRARYEAAAIAELPAATGDGTASGAVTDLLRRAFDALPPLDAQVARLCLAEDVSYAEAAARLGLTEGAVRNRLSRARARLRRDLRDGEEER